ncbi:MAG: HTH domain-containing protein [Saprospiraceae bacterium]
MKKIVSQLEQLQRLDSLIKRKATGSPMELATRLKVSKRTVYNLIDTLKLLGAEVTYDNLRESYIYENDFTFRFEIGNG